MNKAIHIIGGGLAGLSSAVTAAQAGRKVILYEATKTAGGRCRSFFDEALGVDVDNGSHAVLGANPAVFKYLDVLNTRDQLVSINPEGSIPFVDLKTDRRWSIDPGTSRVPWWLLDKRRRTPETSLRDYLQGLGLLVAGKNETVSNVISETNNASQEFWVPFCTAVMNTNMDEASAALLGRALREALFATGGGFQAYVPKTSLSNTFVQPALDYIRGRGADIRLDAAIKSTSGTTTLSSINLRSGPIAIDNSDSVIIAVPPWSPILKPFLNDTFRPEPSPIVNVHYRLAQARPLPPMTGIIGGAGHWVFARDGLVSVTVSAAGHLASLSQDEIARSLWPEVQQTLQLSETALPPCRVIVERRATPVQDCSFATSRPPAQTHFKNLFLAGDWLDTGLPCTLESAIKSGSHAARLALKYR